jgi:hypothetical protein
LAGLPQQDHLLQAAEQARQAGDDQGVQGRRQPAMRFGRQGGGAHCTDLLGQGGCFQ